MERVLKVSNTNTIETDTVYNMDVLDLMASMPDESVDLIIADPPYFEVYGDFDFIWESEEEYLEWLYSCLIEFRRILKPTGTLILWGTLKGEHEALIEVMHMIKKTKLFKKRGLINQMNTRGPGVQDNYMLTAEHCPYYVKSDDFTYHVQYLDEPIGRKDMGANGKPRKNPNKRVKDTWIDRPVEVEEEIKEQVADVWYDRPEASQSSIERCFHPTVKSQGACQRLLMGHSNENDLVFVPFMGAGSEVASCIMNKRHFIGTEIDKDYFEQNIPRIENLCNNETMRKKWCSDPGMSLKILREDSKTHERNGRPVAHAMGEIIGGR